MKRTLAAFLAVALTSGSMPIPASGPDVLSTSKRGHGCCGAMPCCDAGPPCAAASGACAVSAGSGGTSDCSLRARGCGGSSAGLTVVGGDPMLRPGPTTGLEAPGPAGAVALVDRHAGRRASEPAVPPPRA